MDNQDILIFQVAKLRDLTSKNEIIPNKQLVIVKDKNNVYVKIGDGKTPFNDLSYVNPKNVSSILQAFQDIKLNNGVENNTDETAFSAGAFNDTQGQFSITFGLNSKTNKEDNYAFVWNGDESKAILDKYKSHGKGTFNLNPVNGLNGLYIGEKSFKDIINESLKNCVDVENVCKKSGNDEIAKINGKSVYAPKGGISGKLTFKVNGKTAKKIDFSKTKQSEINIKIPEKLSDLQTDEECVLENINVKNLKINGVSIDDYIKNIVIETISRRFYELQQHYSKFIMENFAKFLLEETAIINK